MQNNSLYAISAEYQKAFNELSEMNLDEQTISDSLAAIKDDLDNKAINIAKLIRNIEADAQIVINAQFELAQRAQHLENKAEKLRKYLKKEMEECNAKKIPSPLFDIRIKKNPHTLIIDKGTILSDIYTYTKTEVKKYTDTNKLKADLKNGIKVNGCSLKQNTRLEIK